MFVPKRKPKKRFAYVHLPKSQKHDEKKAEESVASPESFKDRKQEVKPVAKVYVQKYVSDGMPRAAWRKNKGTPF